MSGWGCDEGGDAEATRDGWGAAPTTTRPAVVSNLRDSAVGALFSPDEPSPNEWCGAGYRGRWGVGDGHEDRGDGDDAGGWGGDETFGDGDDAHDWGRSDVVDDDGMSVGAADDAAADDGRWGWGLADDHPDAPRDGPVITDAAARSNDKKGGPIGDADRSELQIATSRDDAPLRVADLADPADKENVEASKRRGTSHPGADAAAAVPAPPRRMHGWKSNWAVEGMVRAKANSLSAPSAPADGKQETSRETPRGAPSSSSPSSSPAGSRDADAASAEARRACDARFAEEADAEEETEETEAPNPNRRVHAWGSDCDSEDELLAGSGLTQARPASPGAERRRVASLRAAVAARATGVKNAFELGAPPGSLNPGTLASVSASDSSDDDFGIAVSTRGRGNRRAKREPAAAARRVKKKTVSSATKTAGIGISKSRGTVDLVDSEDSDVVPPESDAEAEAGAGRTDDGFVNDDADERDARDVSERENERPETRGLGGPMARLPRAPAPAPPAAWRRRLPHFTPASELFKGEYRDGEKVFIDYARQFEGGQSVRNTDPANPAGGGGVGRWFREAGANKFVDADGEVLEGRAAWRASEREKKSAAAAARVRR